MAAVDSLVNTGIIFNRHSNRRGRTFIVTGLYRSGTSMVAAMLQQAGVFIGSEINDAVFEDEAIARVINSGDRAALRQFIAERNASHRLWGFKFPMLWRALNVAQLAMFDQPRLIVTFRDPVAMAVRTSLSEYQDPMRMLQKVAVDQAAMLAFVERLDRPNLLLSYEKALTSPREFVGAIMQFAGMPHRSELCDRLLGLIELNRPNYLASARRRFEGLIEGVRGGQLYGWCQLTRSVDPVTLDVLVDDRVAVTVVADAFRGDLLDAGIGEGSHGWFVALDALQARPESVIRVRVAQHGVELPHSGTRLCDFGTSA